jgi:Ni,Fe-hydrogenase III component G
MFVVCFVMHDKREQQSVAVEVPMASSIEDEVEKHPHHEF